MDIDKMAHAAADEKRRIVTSVLTQRHGGYSLRKLNSEYNFFNFTFFQTNGI